jgi:methylase of polypeptide subunit release factors
VLPYEALLRQAAAGDEERLAQMRAEVAAGTPAPYVAGFLLFRDHRFRIDRRAFITDPETSALVDVVLAEGDRLGAALGRAPRLVEFGVGAGSLAISVKLARPDWRLTGIDIDEGALTLARENAELHAVDLALMHSDFLSALPADDAPDLIFGDPPWGGSEDLYDAERDEGWYRQMPPHSAFPDDGGQTSVHDALIAATVARRWPTLLVLNYGVLPDSVIARSAASLGQWRIAQPAPGISVLVGRAA